MIETILTQINATLSIEWILGGVFSIIVLLIGYIYIATLKDLKDSIRLINESLKHLDIENRARDTKVEIIEYKVDHLEEFDSEKLADSIVNKLRAITPNK